MNNPHYKEMANHFNLPNHSILSMTVHITEKIYHRALLIGQDWVQLSEQKENITWLEN